MSEMHTTEDEKVFVYKASLANRYVLIFYVGILLVAAMIIVTRESFDLRSLSILLGGVLLFPLLFIRQEITTVFCGAQRVLRRQNKLSIADIAGLSFSRKDDFLFEEIEEIRVTLGFPGFLPNTGTFVWCVLLNMPEGLVDIAPIEYKIGVRLKNGKNLFLSDGDKHLNRYSTTEEMKSHALQEAEIVAKLVAKPVVVRNKRPLLLPERH
jgi:hypothetical protein